MKTITNVFFKTLYNFILSLYVLLILNNVYLIIHTLGHSKHKYSFFGKLFGDQTPYPILFFLTIFLFLITIDILLCKNKTQIINFKKNIIIINNLILIIILIGVYYFEVNKIISMTTDIYKHMYEKINILLILVLLSFSANFYNKNIVLKKIINLIYITITLSSIIYIYMLPLSKHLRNSSDFSVSIVSKLSGPFKLNLFVIISLIIISMIILYFDKLKKIHTLINHLILLLFSLFINGTLYGCQHMCLFDYGKNLQTQSLYIFIPIIIIGYIILIKKINRLRLT